MLVLLHRPGWCPSGSVDDRLRRQPAGLVAGQRARRGVRGQGRRGVGEPVGGVAQLGRQVGLRDPAAQSARAGPTAVPTRTAGRPRWCAARARGHDGRPDRRPLGTATVDHRRGRTLPGGRTGGVCQRASPLPDLARGGRLARSAGWTRRGQIVHRRSTPRARRECRSRATSRARVPGDRECARLLGHRDAPAGGRPRPGAASPRPAPVGGRPAPGGRRPRPCAGRRRRGRSWSSGVAGRAAVHAPCPCRAASPCGRRRPRCPVDRAGGRFGAVPATRCRWRRRHAFAAPFVPDPPR